MFIYLADCILTYIVFTDELTNVMLESTDYKIFNVKLPGTGLKFALFCQKRVLDYLGHLLTLLLEVFICTSSGAYFSLHEPKIAN